MKFQPDVRGSVPSVLRIFFQTSLEQFANRSVAHKTRVVPGDVTYGELDAAFEAIEKFLKKYYVLLLGGSLVQAEPTPQFNTHEAFTFPWIEPRKDER